MKKELGIAAFLIVLCSVVGYINPRFVSPANISNLSELIGIFGILSMGAGIVIITGGIDLSVGSVFALQSVLLSIMLVDWHIAWPLATLLAVVFTCVLGLLHAVLIARLRLQAFIVTLAGLLIYRGLARVITGDTTRGYIITGQYSAKASFPVLHNLAQATIGDLFRVPFDAQIHSIFLSIKMPFVLLLVIAFIMWTLLHRSVYGRYLFAVGRNEEAAMYSGINTVLVIGAAYVLNLLLTGIAGVLHAFYVESIGPLSEGMVFELYAIAAAVLGGCSLRGGEGSILGILLGTVLLQVLRNQVNILGIPTAWDYVVTGAAILAAVMLDQLLATLRSRRQRTRPRAA